MGQLCNLPFYMTRLEASLSFGLNGHHHHFSWLCGLPLHDVPESVSRPLGWTWGYFHERTFQSEKNILTRELKFSKTPPLPQAATCQSALEGWYLWRTVLGSNTADTHLFQVQTFGGKAFFHFHVLKTKLERLSDLPISLLKKKSLIPGHQETHVLQDPKLSPPFLVLRLPTG